MSDQNHAWFKVAVAWIGVFIGGVTLSQIALVMTIIFSGLQIYKLIRDMRHDRRVEKFEARLKQPD